MRAVKQSLEMSERDLWLLRKVADRKSAAMTDVSKELLPVCPKCGATIPDLCISRIGTPLPAFHDERYRAQPAPADVVERLRQWASQHSNVTPLDGTDRHSPTFGDLRALLSAMGVSDEVVRLRGWVEDAYLEGFQRGCITGTMELREEQWLKSKARQALTLSGGGS
jgi:hypothetical protein